MTTFGWQRVTEVDAENPVLGDIKKSGGRLALLPDRLARIAQSCTVVLNWWFKEWSFDTTKGVDYLSVLGKVGVREATIRALIARPLKTVPGVREVASMAVAIDRASGACTVSDVAVISDDGQRVAVPGSFGGNV